MAVRVAVVTGANKGIGFAIVRRLCKDFQGEVYLTARSEQNGREAVAKLEAEGLQPKYHQLDITSAESIQALRKYLGDTYGGLDLLVNNAGMAYKSASTVPFVEQAMNTIRANFTGTLDVSKALLPLIRPHGRVVNVSSTVGNLSIVQPHLQEKFLNPDLSEKELVELMGQFVRDVAAGNHVEKGWGKSAYGVSKVGVTALTRVQAREMAQSGKEDVLVNACCPGWVKSDMAGDRAARTPDQGAETPVLLAFLPPGSPSGELWRDKEVLDWVTARFRLS